MASQKDLDRTYMDMARVLSDLSHAKRRKVGALIVRDTHIISEGFNGTPSGFDNECETEDNKHNAILHMDAWRCSTCRKYTSDTKLEKFEQTVCLSKIGQTITKPEVLHAESNAIAKLARSTNSSDGATLYTTCEPCLDCAKLILQAGIVRVVWEDSHPNAYGINLLLNSNHIEILSISGTERGNPTPALEPVEETKKQHWLQKLLNK